MAKKGTQPRRYTGEENRYFLRALLALQKPDGNPNYTKAIEFVRQAFTVATPSKAHFQRLWYERKKKYQEVLTEEIKLPSTDVDSPVNQIVEPTGAPLVEDRRENLHTSWMDVAQRSTAVLGKYLDDIEQRVKTGGGFDLKELQHILLQSKVATDKAEQLKKVRVGDLTPENPSKSIMNVFNFGGMSEEQKETLKKQLLRKATESIPVNN